MDKARTLLVRPGEAAELLGLSRSTVYTLVASGTLPAIRIGGAVRIPMDALQRWIDEQIEVSKLSARKMGGQSSEEPPQGSARRFS